MLNWRRHEDIDFGPTVSRPCLCFIDIEWEGLGEAQGCKCRGCVVE